MAKVTITDFSGGITDTPFTSPENCGEVLENVLIRNDKTIETSPGVQIYHASAYRVPNNTRISKLHRLDTSTILAFSAKKLYKIESGAIAEVTGPTGNSAFNLGGTSSLVSVASFNNHLIATNDSRSYPIKIWKDGSNVTKLVTAGLPQVASNPTITSAAGANAFVYAFVHYFSYTVGTTTYEDYGPIRTVSKTAMAASMSISAIPVLANGVDYNYDTASIKVKIYRTTNGGTTFYYVDQVTNGTTAYTDTTTDANLILNESLYVNGGIQDNDPPSAAKWVWEANNTYFYGDILDGANERPNREIQSITSDPDSVPASFFTPYGGTVTGGGSVGRACIVFTESETIRRDGVLDETGRGSIFKEPLSSTVGCAAHNSIVKGGLNRLYWAASDGFYVTDGYSAPRKLAMKSELSSKIDAPYKALQNKNKIQGCYDKNNKRVYWTVQEDAADNDKIYVYDESFDSFTTLTNSSGILPTALMADGDDVLIGDGNGYLFKLSSAYYTYPAVSVGTLPSTWGTDAIIYRWKSIHAGFGDSSINKWITKVNAQGNPTTNVDIACKSYTNGEPEFKELYPFSLSPSIAWGDTTFTWGDTALVWDRTAVLNQTRRFPAGRLRARHRAIELTNAYVIIQTSNPQAASYVTVNGTLDTAVLVTPASYEFPVNYDGYYVTINGLEYEITKSTATTLTIADPSNTLPTGNYPYIIKGYPKAQRAHIMSISLEYEMLTDTGTFAKGVA